MVFTHSIRRIYLPMSSLFFGTLVKRLGQEGIQNAMSMHTEVFVVKLERAMTDGKVRYLLWVLIIIWELLTLNGMQQPSTVSLPRCILPLHSTQASCCSLLISSMGTLNSIRRGHKAGSERRRRGCGSLRTGEKGHCRRQSSCSSTQA